jgi:hypothetical protein
MARPASETAPTQATPARSRAGAISGGRNGAQNQRHTSRARQRATSSAIRECSRRRRSSRFIGLFSLPWIRSRRGMWRYSLSSRVSTGLFRVNHGGGPRAPSRWRP